MGIFFALYTSSEKFSCGIDKTTQSIDVLPLLPLPRYRTISSPVLVSLFNGRVVEGPRGFFGNLLTG